MRLIMERSKAGGYYHLYSAAKNGQQYYLKGFCPEHIHRYTDLHLKRGEEVELVAPIHFALRGFWKRKGGKK